MRTISWRAWAAGVILAGGVAAVACSVTTTGVPAGPVDGLDSGTTPIPTPDSGVVETPDTGTGVTVTPDAGTGGQCVLSNRIGFGKQACADCAGSMCCTEINTCVDDMGDCSALFGCVLNCVNGVDGGAPPAADAGGCNQDCAALHQPSVLEFNTWQNCLSTKCTTECTQ